MKYRILEDEITYVEDGTPLYRIQAINGTEFIKPGTKGGWIQSTDNLSQSGRCWVSDRAAIYGSALVTGNAQVAEDARVFDNARVQGDALISGYSKVYGLSSISGWATIKDNSKIFGTSKISGYVSIIEDAGVYGNNIQIFGTGVIDRHCTRTPIFMDGMQYRITIMDEHIRLGSDDCGWTPTFEEFANITERELLEIDNRKAVEFYRQNRDWLYALCLSHASGELKGPDAGINN